MADAVDPEVWAEWLSLYVEHSRQRLSARERRELAGALREGVRRRSLAKLVSAHAAEEGRWLVAFLAQIEDPVVQGALVTEASARLAAVSPRS